MMDRRTFIAAGAAMPLAGHAFGSPSTDPLPELFDRWYSLRKDWDRLSYLTDDWDRPDLVSNEKERGAIENRMLQTKATSVAGLAALARYQWEECGYDTVLPTKADRRDHGYRVSRIILLSTESMAGLPPHQPLHFHRGAPMPEDF